VDARDFGNTLGMGSVTVADDQLPPSAPPAATATAGGRCYQDIVFAQTIGYRPLLMDLHVPERDEAAPVIMCIYGGGFAMGSHKTDRPGAYLTRRLVAEGFAVARPQYRHSREARFPAQVHDVKAAVRWLRHHAADVGIDPGRIAAWGSSSGGYLATMLAVTGGTARLEGTVGLVGPSSAIQAAVAWSAPVNITRLPPPPAESPFHRLGADPHDWLLAGRAEDHPELATEATTSTHVSLGSSPLILVHGDADTAIPIEQPEEMVSAYERAGAVVDFAPIPGADHVFDDATREAQATAGISFLLNYLAGAEGPKN